ncbi:MAG: ROK family protein [Candidatus Weimeria sp.]
MQNTIQHDQKLTAAQRRRHTRNSIYRFIYRSGSPVSKQEIASALDLSLPTVYKNINELTDEGCIRAGELQESTGGRPPVGFEVNPDYRYTLGIAITSNHFRFWAGDLKHQELAYKSIRIPNSSLDEIDISELKKDMEDFLAESKLDISRLAGIGITIPGVFDESSEKILLSPTLGVKDFSVSDLIMESDVPIAVMNDSTCAGYEERRLRQMCGQPQDFVYLLMENGVGGAVFMDGRLISGGNGRSGEFGHMRIVPDGRECSCGQRGCLEAYCSALRITRDLGLTVEQFFDQLKKENGSGPRTELFTEMLRYLSIGIINLRMAFDCDIVLGGFMSEYLAPYLDFLKKEVRALDPFDADPSYLKIAASPKAPLQGAAWYQVVNFIEDRF